MPAKKTAKKTTVPPSSMSALRDKLGKRYGDQVVRREEITKYRVLSTGSLAMDVAHRVGGYVEGRIHEIVGPEGVGKTSLCIATMIEAQRKYPAKAVGYIDMEQTFDYDWAEALGLDTSPEHWMHLYPDDSEDVSDMLKEQIETGLFSVVVVDSIGGMESKEAFDKEAEDKVVGRNAQVITRMVKRCAVLCRRHQVTALLVNQLRANIGGFGGDQSAGPKALKYSTTTKTIMSGTSDEPIYALLPGDKDPTIISRKVRGRVSRSKVAIQGKAGEFYLINADTPQFGPVGIDRADEAITIGIFYNIIVQKGAWYYLTTEQGKEHRWQGRAALLDHLRASPDDLEYVRLQAVAAVSGDVVEEAVAVLEHAGADA